MHTYRIIFHWHPTGRPCERRMTIVAAKSAAEARRSYHEYVNKSRIIDDCTRRSPHGDAPRAYRVS